MDLWLAGSGYLTASLALLAGPGSYVLGRSLSLGKLLKRGSGVEKHRELAQQSIRNIRSSNPELLTGVPPRLQIRAGNALSGKNTLQGMTFERHAYRHLE